MSGELGPPPSPAVDGSEPSPSPSEEKSKEGSHPRIVGGILSAQPSPGAGGGTDDDGGDYGSYDEPELKEKLKALQRIEPSPHASVLGPRKPPAVRASVISDYTSCIFPTSFFQIIEAGRIFQRATIPYRFIQLLEKETLDELTDDFFLIFCARNGNDKASSKAFYETKDPQDLIEGIFNQYDAEDALLPVASGLNAAIRTYVNWHKHCMMITADYFEHRQQVTKKILLDYHYALDDYDPKQEAQNTIFANRFYSYALSLALARGYAKAYPSSKKTALRGEAKRVDAGKAWTIYAEVETLFLKYVNNDKLPSAAVQPPYDDDSPLSTPDPKYPVYDFYAPGAVGQFTETGRNVLDDSRIASTSELRGSFPLVNFPTTPGTEQEGVPPQVTPGSALRPALSRDDDDQRYVGIFKEIQERFAGKKPGGMPPKCIRQFNALEDKREQIVFAKIVALYKKGTGPLSAKTQGRIKALKKQLGNKIDEDCYIQFARLYNPTWLPVNSPAKRAEGTSYTSPGGRQFGRGEGFADVDPEEESTDDELDAAMAEHMLDGP